MLLVTYLSHRALVSGELHPPWCHEVIAAEICTHCVVIASDRINTGLTHLK